MSRSISWIDQGRFQALLGEASVSGAAPRPLRKKRPSRTLHAEPLVHRNTPPPPPPMPPPPLPTPPPRDSRVMPQVNPAAEPVRQTRPYRPSAGAVEERAAALLDWAMERFKCESCFVTDGQGLAVVERNSQQEHRAVCATLVGALDEMRPMLGQEQSSMSVLIDDARVLSCVVEDTDWGRLTMGVVQEQALRIVHRQTIAAALRRAFSEQETHE